MAPERYEINHLLDNRFPLNSFLVIFISFTAICSIKKSLSFHKLTFYYFSKKNIVFKKIANEAHKKMNHFAYKFKNYSRYSRIKRNTEENIKEKFKDILEVD